ncbi:MAG TPA: YigZ family protein [Methanocorpusculum sp.]|nr:YigZ family protein [Methanocorpusculum sp.]
MAFREVAAVRLNEKKSKFYAHLYEIDTVDDVLGVRKIHDQLYKKAAHHCYAMVYGTITASCSDGEVGSPGRILAGVLARNHLDAHMLIVSRIFGGVKLGPARVARAFRDAGVGAVEVYQKEQKVL